MATEACSTDDEGEARESGPQFEARAATYGDDRTPLEGCGEGTTLRATRGDDPIPLAKSVKETVPRATVGDDPV